MTRNKIRKSFREIQWDKDLLKELSKVSGKDKETIQDIVQLLCVLDLIK